MGTLYRTCNRTVFGALKDDISRIITSDDLRARLGKELDALRETEDALYVSKRGRLTAVVLDSERYAELVERLDFLEDSLAALQARDERDTAVPWSDVRGRSA